MFEYKTIKIAVYQTSDGKPTCADIESGHACRFLGSRKFGLIPVCMAGTNVGLIEYDMSFYLEPQKDCILWGGSDGGATEVSA